VVDSDWDVRWRWPFFITNLPRVDIYTVNVMQIGYMDGQRVFVVVADAGVPLCSTLIMPKGSLYSQRL